MSMDVWLTHFLALWRPLGYSFVFLGVMVEGDLFVLTTAALVRFGYFDVFTMLAIAYSGLLVGDLLWFYAGVRLAQSESRIARWFNHHVKHISLDVQSNFFLKLLVSKFIYGTHHATLFTLGSTKMPLSTYLRYEIPAAFVWLILVGGIGYIFASALASAKHWVRSAELLILAILLVYLVWAALLRKQVHLEKADE